MDGFSFFVGPFAGLEGLLLQNADHGHQHDEEQQNIEQQRIQGDSQHYAENSSCAAGGHGGKGQLSVVASGLDQGKPTAHGDDGAEDDGQRQCRHGGHAQQQKHGGGDGFAGNPHHVEKADAQTEYAHDDEPQSAKPRGGPCHAGGDEHLYDQSRHGDQKGDAKDLSEGSAIHAVGRPAADGGADDQKQHEQDQRQRVGGVLRPQIAEGEKAAGDQRRNDETGGKPLVVELNQ